MLANLPIILNSPDDYMHFPEKVKENQITALVVIDDIFATLTHPYLTSIDIDIHELGTLALQKLYEKLNDIKTTSIRLAIPHRLIARETVLKRK